MRALDVWYARADIDEVEKALRNKLGSNRRKSVDQAVPKARGSDSLKAFAKLTEITDDGVRIKADPPLLVPIADLLPDADRAELELQVNGPAAPLPPHAAERPAGPVRPVRVRRHRPQGGRGGQRRHPLLDRAAARPGRRRPAVPAGQGGGSVGARAHVPIGMRQRGPRNEGERVVVGQRLMQAASDIFLGWQRIEGIDGRERDFYVRQLRDMKGSAEVERMDPVGMTLYGAALRLDPGPGTRPLR